jgi:uncharacterized RDD family membrane protein YckC
MSCLAHPLNGDAVPCARCGAPYCDDCLVVLRDERLCATCKDDVLRDVISGMAVERKPLARLPQRLAAYFIDRAIFYAFIAGLISLDGPLRKTGVIPGRIVNIQLVFVAVLYAGFGVYEGWLLSARGQTLGKMAARVRVVRTDGTPITRKQAWGRAFIRSLFLSVWYAVTLIHWSDAVIWIFFLTLLDPLLALVTPQRTALHDLAARTRVYRTE